MRFSIQAINLTDHILSLLVEDPPGTIFVNNIADPRADDGTPIDFGNPAALEAYAAAFAKRYYGAKPAPSTAVQALVGTWTDVL